MCDGNLAMANRFVDMSEEQNNELHDKEMKRIEKEIENLEYLATTLEYEHQKSLRIELEMKADNLRKILNQSK